MNNVEHSTDVARDKLFSAIDQRQREIIDLVADLVRFPSTLGNERPAQDFVASHLAGSNCQAEVWEMEEKVKLLPNAGESGIPFARRPNVTARMQGSGGGHSLILNGHIDVVSAEPIVAWETDPYSPTFVGERLYGRGAWDMKSGLALNLMLARLLTDLNIELRGDLLLQSVIEEECTGNGALAAAQRDRADATLITESTNQTFTRAHVGVAWFTVTVTGRAWHAMQARQGVNAIEKCVPVINALRRLDDELNRAKHPLYAHLEHPINLNIGVMRAGDWPSTVPGKAEITCRVSVFPGESIEQLHQRIENAIMEEATKDAWLSEHPPVVTYHGFGSEGSVIDTAHPFVQLLATRHEALIGEELAFQSSTGICDMKAFNLTGVPCGCYGARGGNAHGANEWLDTASLAPALKVIGATVLDWCGVAKY